MHFSIERRLLLVMVSAILSTCVTTESEAEYFKPAENSVQLADQKYIVEKLKSTAVETEARCLFTYSGWAYPGQHCIFIENGAIRLFEKLQNAKQFRELQRSELKVERKLVDFDNLSATYKNLKSTYAAALDHTRFQYLVFKNKNGNVVVVQDLLIDNPHASKEHIAFTSEFVDLFKTNPSKLK